MDRGGYVPGESIGISASVTNRSSVTVKSTKAALTEVSIFVTLKTDISIFSILCIQDRGFIFVLSK